ncbi:MAG TPA: AAA family ATPase [Kofleriaceae bacterium]|nr:AAA family ATPase [Kofleriaceae bacterium]
MADAGSWPREPTGFYGREEDLAAIGALFRSDARLVTLVGLGGIGKTRLAIRHARTSGMRTLFCDLGEAREVSSLYQAVAGRLGVTLDGVSDLAAAERIGRALAEAGPLLLVIDDLDRLAPTGNAAIGIWLDLAPEVDVLVTSRQPLECPDEHVRLVGPLDAGAAAELYIARAHARGATIDDATRPTIDDLVERLDRHPLSIELAASHATVLSPRQVIEQLEDRFGILRAAGAQVPARHAVLERLIEASWSLLPAADQEALAQASVFRGGFSADAARAVLALPDGGSPVPVLTRARELMLLRAEPAPDHPDELRYALLESVRDFAAGVLDRTGGRAAAERRHADHFLERAAAWSRELDGRTCVDAQARLTLELANLVAIHDRFREADPALALRAVLAVETGVAGPGPVDLLERLLASAAAIAPAIADPRLLAALAAAQGRLQRVRPDMSAAIEELARARRIAASIPDPAAEADALAWIGMTELEQSRLELARQAFLAALDLLGETPSAVHARCRYGIAVVDHLMGQAAGPEHYDVALAWCRRAGDLRTECRVLKSSAGLHMELDDMEGFWGNLERAETLAREVGAVREQGIILMMRGQARLEVGQPERAEEDWLASLPLFRRAGYRLGEGMVLGGRARLHHERGELDAAERLYVEARLIAQEGSFRTYAHALDGYLGVLALERGRLADAERRLAAACVGLVATGDSRYSAFMTATWAVALARSGRRAEAEAALADARAQPSVQRAGSDDAHVVEILASLVEGGAAPPPATEPRDWHARVARRLLAPAGPAAQAEEPAEQLVIGPGCAWLTRGGHRSDLRRRGAVRRILRHLTARRRDRPGTSLSVAELFDVGWPGEQATPEAAATRVYWAIATLRRLGLQGILLTRDDGYALDEQADVRVEQT